MVVVGASTTITTQAGDAITSYARSSSPLTRIDRGLLLELASVYTAALVCAIAVLGVLVVPGGFAVYHWVRLKQRDRTNGKRQCRLLHRVRKKRCHVIFDYNSRLSWLIFIIFFTVKNMNEYCTISCNLLT